VELFVFLFMSFATHYESEKMKQERGFHELESRTVLCHKGEQSISGKPYSHTITHAACRIFSCHTFISLFIELFPRERSQHLIASSKTFRTECSSPPLSHTQVEYRSHSPVNLSARKEHREPWHPPIDQQGLHSLSCRSRQSPVLLLRRKLHHHNAAYE